MLSKQIDSMNSHYGRNHAQRPLRDRAGCVSVQCARPLEGRHPWWKLREPGKRPDLSRIETQEVQGRRLGIFKE